MADPITSNLEVDVPEMEMEMDSYPSLLKAVEQYNRCVLCNFVSTHAFSAIKQYSAQYETQRRINELEQFCEECMYYVPYFMKIVTSFLEVVDIDEKNSYKMTALTWMSKEGHTKIVQILIEAGAGLDIMDYKGRTALIWASSEGYTDIVEILIKAGADLDIKYGDGGETALMWAICKEYTDIAKLLINAGADLDIKDGDGETALTWAIDMERTDIAKLLIDAGGK
tara:strand:- start:176 stop:853 length:678 start_codon:yes stop_codon:yes gene_type:complete